MKNFIKKMLDNELVEDVAIAALLGVCAYIVICVTSVLQ